MRLKRGVKLNGMSPQILLAIVIAAPIFSKYQKRELVITSVTDSKHGRGSKHFIGNAVDLRTRTLDKAPSQANARLVTNDLVVALGAEFDVVLEKDHIHVEWDPK